MRVPEPVSEGPPGLFQPHPMLSEVWGTKGGGGGLLRLLGAISCAAALRSMQALGESPAPRGLYPSRALR